MRTLTAKKWEEWGSQQSEINRNAHLNIKVGTSAWIEPLYHPLGKLQPANGHWTLKWDWREVSFGFKSALNIKMGRILRILCPPLQFFEICSRIKKSKVCKIFFNLSDMINIILGTIIPFSLPLGCAPQMPKYPPGKSNWGSNYSASLPSYYLQKRCSTSRY